MTYKSDPLSTEELAEVRERRLRPDGHRLMGSDYPRLLATIEADRATITALKKQVAELQIVNANVTIVATNLSHERDTLKAQLAEKDALLREETERNSWRSTVDGWPPVQPEFEEGK